MKYKFFIVVVLFVLFLSSCPVVVSPSLNFAIDPPAVPANYSVYYKFNSDLNDTSSNGNHGNAPGSTIKYTDNRFAEAGNAISFSGDDGVMTPLTDMKGNFSVSFWFKVDTKPMPGQLYPLFTKHTAPERGDAGLEFGLFFSGDLRGSRLIFKMGSGNDGNNDNASGISQKIDIDKFGTGKWFFVAVTLDNDEVYVYIGDSQQKLQKVDTSQQPGIFQKGKRQLGNNPLIIGKFENDPIGTAPRATTYFKGAIDTFIIWKGALPAKSIKDIYNFSSAPTNRIELVSDFNQFGRADEPKHGKVILQGNRETIYETHFGEIKTVNDNSVIYIPDLGDEFFTLTIQRESYGEFSQDYHISELKQYAGNQEPFPVEKVKWQPDLEPVRITEVTADTATISWTPPVEDGALDYMVFLSTEDNLQSVRSSMENTVLPLTYITDTTYTFTGLTEAQNYYFNVVARRRGIQKALYINSGDTIRMVAPDGTAPIPGNNGIININSIDYTRGTINMSWTSASDNITASESMVYMLYHSTVPYATLDEILNNATAMGAPFLYKPSAILGSLPFGTNFFYVTVQDSAGHKALYRRVQEYFTPNLIAHYKLNSGSADDFSGNENHGIPRGSFASAVDRYGDNQGSLLFNGTNYVITPITSLTGDYTISLWMYITNPADEVLKPFISKHTIDGASDQFAEFNFGMYYYDYGFFFMGNGTTSNGGYGLSLFTVDQIHNPPLPAPQGPNWRHVVVTTAGSTAKLFLNGQLQAETSFDTSGGGIRQGGTLPIQIGRYSNDLMETLYKGRLDDIRIFSAALSDAEILNLFNAEKP